MKTESSYFALGVTESGRKIMCVFTIRKDKIRVTSVRNMNKNERQVYEKAE